MQPCEHSALCHEYSSIRLLCRCLSSPFGTANCTARAIIPGFSRLRIPVRSDGCGRDVPDWREPLKQRPPARSPSINTPFLCCFQKSAALYFSVVFRRVPLSITGYRYTTFVFGNRSSRQYTDSVMTGATRTPPETAATALLYPILNQCRRYGNSSFMGYPSRCRHG